MKYLFKLLSRYHGVEVRVTDVKIELRSVIIIYLNRFTTKKQQKQKIEKRLKKKLEHSLTTS